MPTKRDPAAKQAKQLELAKKACDRWTALASDETIGARHRRSMMAAAKPIQQLIAMMEKSLAIRSSRQHGGADDVVPDAADGATVDATTASVTWHAGPTADPTSSSSQVTTDVSPFTLGGIDPYGGMTSQDAGRLLPTLGGGSKKRAKKPSKPKKH